MDSTDLAAINRRAQRRKEASQFVTGAGLSLNSLAESTQRCLDEWACQRALVCAQPSANHGAVVLQLCRAVESEVGHVLGDLPGLEFLARPKALGQKVHQLRSLSKATRQNLGMKPGSLDELARMLSALNKLRLTKDVAHGGANLAEASADDARAAERLTQRILGCVHAASACR